MGNHLHHIVFQNLPQQTAKLFRIHSSQYFKYMIIGKLLSQIKGNALIQQAQRVTHRTVRFLGNIAQRLLFHLYLFFIHQLPHSVSNRSQRNTFKIITLTPRQNGNRNFMCLRGSQDKNHIRRRFL